MSSLAWREELAIGNAEIDAQHRTIVEHFHAMRATAAADPHDPALDAQLAELIRLTESHFRDEETLMRALSGGTARFATHFGEHRMLLFELVKLRDELARTGAGVGPTVIEFLERWLYEHMSTFDRELGDLEPEVREPVPWLEPE